LYDLGNSHITVFVETPKITQLTTYLRVLKGMLLMLLMFCM